MRVFRDDKGRDWEVEINVATLERAKSVAGVDLIAFVRRLDANSLVELIADPITLAHTIYAVCLPQARAKGIDEDEFCAGFRGDAIARAARAIAEELADFSPRPEIRASLRRVVDGIYTRDEVVAKEIERISESTLRPDVIRAEVTRAIASATESGAPSTSLPASSGSIPVR